MGLSRLERETVVNFNDLEKVAYISTRQQSVKTRLKKLGIEPIHKQADYEVYEVPKNWIKISKPKKVSDSQRKAAARNMNKFHSQRSSIS